MNKNIVKENSHFQFIECDAADTVTVVFAARNDRPPKFTFWKAANAMNSHVILLNSDVPEWYRAGIPGISGGIRGAVKAITDFKNTVKASRLVMTGSSMGGYGALLYGSMAKADHVLAFGVEPLLGIPGGKTDITRNHLQYMYPDLTSLSLPPSTVYYGGMDINDILGAWLLRKRRNSEIVCIPEAQHDTPDFLARHGLLNSVFADIITGKKISTYEYGQGDAANDEIVDFLWKLNNQLVEKDWTAIRKKISHSEHLTSNSPLLEYLYGIAHFRNHDFNNAYKALNTLTMRIPGYWEAWMNLGAVNLKLGNIDEAIKSCSNAIKLRPHRSIAHIQLSHIYSKAGSNDLAFEHAQWACKLNYSRPEYFDALAKTAALANKSVPDKENYAVQYNENVKAAQSKFSDYNFYTKKA
ncbi:tetratricopeptide repeat protein [Pseudomonas sp. UYIF39]|uniref:tetratricopeptide repeat protein n=1 Tax=Pseudomonas sp. UYIF39 TaxID=1630747 RepID=UPI00249F1FAC|nr:tetratricopeptide repeat protein [Pseudomonas sp. UYIF39]MDI3356848.1 tetratricopeptide repeat protein [Pseudomonas sp. UYIF39]